MITAKDAAELSEQNSHQIDTLDTVIKTAAKKGLFTISTPKKVSNNVVKYLKNCGFEVTKHMDGLDEITTISWSK